jgi:hypothetical protein
MASNRADIPRASFGFSYESSRRAARGLPTSPGECQQILGGTLPRVRDNAPRASKLLFWKLARENSELMDIRRIACAGTRTPFDEVTRFSQIFALLFGRDAAKASRARRMPHNILIVDDDADLRQAAVKTKNHSTRPRPRCRVLRKPPTVFIHPKGSSMRLRLIVLMR